MALKHRCARAREDIVNAGKSVSACSCKFITGAVETGIKHLVVVTAESLDALAAADVPEFACPVDGACQTVISSEVKLAARKLSLVPFQREDALARAHIPDLGCVVKRGSKKLVSISVEAERDDFGVVPN